MVERACVTVMGRARAMMNHAGFTMAKRQQLWCETAQTATLLDKFWYKTVPKVHLLLNFWSRCKVCQALESFWINVWCVRYR